MAAVLDWSPQEQAYRGLQRNPAAKPPSILGDFPAIPGAQQQPVEDFMRRNIEMRVSSLEEKVKKLSSTGIGFIKINLLPKKTLRIPLDAIVEPDKKGFIVRLTDLPLYGCGEDPKEAIEMLKREIESLYEDLMEDDEFSDEWLRVKKFLAERITE